MFTHPLRFYLLLLLAALSLLFSVCQGSTSFAWTDILKPNTDTYSIIFNLRLPRTLSAFTCGGLLALAGVLMQLLLRNPLADPYILGISGGAALAALLAILLGLSETNLTFAAWIGSLLAGGCILFLALKHQFRAQRLLLTGIVLASGFGALISFILLISPNDQLQNMLFWLNGDLTTTQYPFMGLGILFTGFLICQFLAPGMNVLTRGEMESYALGLSTGRYRFYLYVLTSLFTATAVTMAGCIGFVGLIIPHIVRLWVGYDHRVVIPCSILLGGAFLTLADTLARTLFAPQQLPVGIFMAMLGLPLFIWLLRTTA